MAVFWNVAPCSLVEFNQSFRGAYCLHHQDDTLIALMMGALSTYETLVNFYQTTQRNISEDSHLRTHHRENLKSHSFNTVCVFFAL
jgi:hypothetical protein